MFIKYINGKYKLLYINEMHFTSSFLNIVKIPYNQSVCSFCCNNFSENTRFNFLIILKCDHVYHIDCFVKYIYSKISIHNVFNIECPLCRNDDTYIIDVLACYKKLLKLIYNVKQKLFVN